MSSRVAFELQIRVLELRHRTTTDITVSYLTQPEHESSQ